MSTTVDVDGDEQAESMLHEGNQRLHSDIGGAGSASSSPSPSPSAAAAAAEHPDDGGGGGDGDTPTPAAGAPPSAAATASSASSVDQDDAAAPSTADSDTSAPTGSPGPETSSDDTARQRSTFESGQIRSCEDIPWTQAALFSGGPIFISGDTTIRSDKDIFTKDVLWVVGPGVRVKFEAPTVTLALSKRSQLDGENEVLIAHGMVQFDVHGWVPSFSDGAPENNGLLTAEGRGSIYFPPDHLRFSDNTVVAARPSAGGDVDEVAGEDALGLTTADDVHISEYLGFMFSDLRDKNGKSTQQSARPGDGDGSSSSSGRTTAGVDGDGSSSSGSSNNKDEAGTDNAGGDWDERQHPGAMLRVGERLTKILVSPDLTSGLFADADNASLRFYHDGVSAPPADGNADGDEEAPLVATLIRANPGKMERVYQIRSEIAEEDAERARLGGQGGRRVGLVRRLQRLCFWGKHGFPRVNKRRKAREHLGDVYITLTERGVVEGYVDSTRVLKEGGSSWFAFLRQRSEEYQLHATDDGMEPLPPLAHALLCWLPQDLSGCSHSLPSPVGRRNSLRDCAFPTIPSVVYTDSAVSISGSRFPSVPPDAAAPSGGGGGGGGTGPTADISSPSLQNLRRYQFRKTTRPTPLLLQCGHAAMLLLLLLLRSSPPPGKTPGGEMRLVRRRRWRQRTEASNPAVEIPSELRKGSDSRGSLARLPLAPPRISSRPHVPGCGFGCGGHGGGGGHAEAAAGVDGDERGGAVGTGVEESCG
eukprot:g13480.t2